MGNYVVLSSCKILFIFIFITGRFCRCTSVVHPPGTFITDYFSQYYDVIENGPYEVVVGLIYDFVAVNDSFLEVYLLFSIPLSSNLQVTSYLNLPYDHFKYLTCLKAQYILIDALSLKGPYCKL